MRAASKPFLCLLALLVGAELVVRVFFARSMAGRFDYGYHPTAGFVERADGTVRLERAGGRRFFPQSFSRERPTNTFRIFVIGDSVARGHSVADSYAGRLGETLRARGVSAESFNLSLPGFGARRKHLVLEQALRFQPSLVILHVNDSNEYEDEREWRRREEFQGWHPKNWLMKSLALRRLYEMKQERIFWEWLPSAIRQQRAASDADAHLQAALDGDKVRTWSRLVREQTTADAALVQRQGVKLLLLAHATADLEQANPVTDDHGLAALCESLRAGDVAVVSLKSLFAGQDPRKVFSDGSHFRAAGQQLVAEALAGTLAEAGWLPPQVPKARR